MNQSNLVRLLTERRDAIVKRFVDEVRRKELAPPDTSKPLLVDHIPTFLDEIIAELANAEGVSLSQDAPKTSATAREHGVQRWALGYDLQALVREYGVLRHCIVRTAKESDVSFSMDEFDVMARRLSVGVADAVAAYVEHSEAEVADRKAQQDFPAEAGELLASSLDYRTTLGHLTRLIVPRLADWCSIHMAGVGIDVIPIAHADPAKIESLREMYRRFPLSKDAPYGARRALETGESQLIAELTPDIFAELTLGPEHAAMFRATAFRSGMAVPLVIQGNAIGVILFAYGESGRSYDESDLRFAGELARRAAIAIDNARLYELSQNERSRVEAATRAKDEFVAVVSHELRTPLNAILGWVRLLRGGGVAEAKREHALEVIERNARAQDHLVADLLDVSRILTGAIRITPSQVDLANVVEMATEAVRPAADAKGIAIRVEVDPGSTVMRGDGDRLQQVVWNLLSNAVKFTPKSGGVRVRVKRVESDLELTVEDDGVGIEPAFLPHVFDSFLQADGGTTRRHGGLGLGLSISKHLIELHGGTIEAESAGVGHGSLFRIRLPISPLVSTTMGVTRVPAMQPRDDAPPREIGFEGIRVLVVDDEEDARELLVYVLEAAGMDVRMAGSAAAAMATLQAFTPDVVVSDIGMPVEDGYSLIRSIRTLPDEAKKNVPSIALTAFARNEDRTRALVAGFNLHMAKPVDPSLLLRAVADLAGRGSSGSSPA